MGYPIHHFGGSGPLLNFAVANGFPPETYVPIFRFLIPHYRVMSLLPRALWANEIPPSYQLLDWRETLAQDMLSGMVVHELQHVIAVGHSFGGIASLLAALQEPKRFRALILLDPTILAPDMLAMIDAARQSGMADQIPLAVRALKRQREFESVDAAYHYLKSRPLFAAWDDEALRMYAEQGTRACGDKVCLRWTPDWEAYYFKTIYTRIWDDLPNLNKLKLPVLIVRGGDSDTFLPDSAEKVCELVPKATYLELPGHGHLFPQTAPAQTAQIILDWLKEHKIVRP